LSIVNVQPAEGNRFRYVFSVEPDFFKRYDLAMVATKKEALEIAAEARRNLENIYGQRLRGVYLYGSAARDQLTPDSDIDIAVILDKIPSRFEEHERTSQLGSDISLEYNTVVLFFFAEESDLEAGRFAIHRAIKDEGIRL
jgi:predicted nucleotidyltransferase